jgi:hypothetical protein
VRGRTIVAVLHVCTCALLISLMFLILLRSLKILWLSMVLFGVARPFLMFLMFLVNVLCFVCFCMLLMFLMNGCGIRFVNLLSHLSCDKD